MSTHAYKGTDCGCPGCLASRRERLIDSLTRDSLRIAVRHAQEYPEQEHPEQEYPGQEYPGQEHSESWPFEAGAGPMGLPTTLPLIPFYLSWSEHCPVQGLPLTADVPMPAHVPARFRQLYDKKGLNLIYAFMRRGVPKPMYIGSISGGARSMRDRLRTYFNTELKGKIKSATEKVTQALRDPANQTELYLVLATYTAGDYAINGNMTRVVEGILQAHLQPEYWDSSIRSFEEDETESAESELADLVEEEL